MEDGHEVRCIADMIDCLRSIRRHEDQELWYRGHGSRSYTLAPTIWRGYSRADERNFTNRFRARAAIRYPNSPAYDDNAHWLSLMQHYGVPTRLLDWTRSPLIAAYFALERYLDGAEATEDAQIWILDPFGLNTREGFSPITPAIDANVCLDMLLPAFSDRPGIAENDRVIAVMAAETDLRMFVQQGCFTIHSRSSALDAQGERDPHLTSMIIPADSVRSVADEIRICGFRKGDLYPDLANLASELKISHPEGWSGP